MFAPIRHIGWLLAVLCMIAQGCSPRVADEAKTVVAQADSMRAEGGMYNDSVQLAKAYRTLHRQRAFYPDEYAHCCYHYGRLLRKHDDPVAAMQVFINATHSGTKDYHILGRVYSNMGEIAHLAGEFPLSYDMFERSGEMFLKKGDTIAYYYALNDMAFELAEQGKKEEAQVLLSYIERHCFIKDVIAKTWETKAVANKKVEQYDSTIYYTSLSMKNGYYSPTILLNRAQVYSFMGVKDSAVYYANIVLKRSNKTSHVNNALYILTNDIQTDKVDSIRQKAADRSDIQLLLSARQGELSQATQLLQQDLTRKPDFAWLYAVIATLAIVGGGIIIYVRRKHKKHGLLVQKVDELQQAAYAIQEKHDELKELYSTNHQYIEDDINNRCSMLQSNDKIKNTLAWKNYDKMCTIVDKQFYLLASKLRNKQCLNETEVRLCILTLLNCGYDQMAELLYHSATSIGTLKMRVAKKLGTTSKQLRQYLIDNECIR